MALNIPQAKRPYTEEEFIYSLYSTVKFIKNKNIPIWNDQHLAELVESNLTSHQSNFRQLTKMDNAL